MSTLGISINPTGQVPLEPIVIEKVWEETDLSKISLIWGWEFEGIDQTYQFLYETKEEKELVIKTIYEGFWYSFKNYLFSLSCYSLVNQLVALNVRSEFKKYDPGYEQVMEVNHGQEHIPSSFLNRPDIEVRLIPKLIRNNRCSFKFINRFKAYRGVRKLLVDLQLFASLVFFSDTLADGRTVIICRTEKSTPLPSVDGLRKPRVIFSDRITVTRGINDLLVP